MHRPFTLASLVLFTAAIGGCVDNSGAAPTGDGGILIDTGLGDDSSAPPSVTISLGTSAVVDFGMVACGGAAPAAQTFSVTNTGQAEVQYSLSLSATSAFQIVGPTSGQLAPGNHASVTISVSAEPTSATAGAVDQATLTITTNDPAHPSTPITLKRTAQGATLTLAAPAAFLDTPVDATSQPVGLVLTNTGNLATSVTLGAPSDPQFALTWTGAASSSVASPPVALAPNAAVPGLSATFSPTAAGPASATSALTVTGPVCGSSASSIAYSGNGTQGVVAVSPATLPFGLVDCGGKAAAPQTVTIKNTGSASFNYTATLLLGASSHYTLSASADAGADATGSVAPGSSAVVTVTPVAIPKVASVATNAFGDTLRITSDALGDANHDVTLTETAQGAVLSLSASTLPLGNVTLLQTASTPFTISNAGNLPATVTLAAPGAPFGVTPAAATVLTVGGAPLAGSATYKPTGLGGASGSVAITTAATDVVCSAPIGPIHLTGTGVNGVMALSTNVVDFAAVPCGQQAGTQTFTINNTGTAPFTWKAALGKTPSPYVVSPLTGTQNPGSAATTITVTPAAIPFPSALTANLYGDTLTITPTGISGGTAQSVALQETAEGAIVTATPSPLPSFGNQQEGQASAAAALKLTNTGSMAVTLTPSLGGTNPTSFSLASAGATLLAANGGTFSPGPTFKPLATGALSAQLTVAKGTNDVLCQALPAALTLAGTGTNGAVTVGSGSVGFTTQACGATTGVTTTVKLTNNGTASLNFNAVVLGSSGFQVSPATGTIAAGGAFTNLTVTSPVFSSSLGNVNAVTDTLRITTTAYQDTNHDVPLSSTPSGAILAWETGAGGLAFGTVEATSDSSVSSGQPFSLVNSGNVAATVSFATQGKDQYTFTPQNSSVPVGATALNGTATFTPTSSGLQSDAMVVNVAAGTPLCAAAPAAVALTGTGAQGIFSAGTPPSLELTCNSTPVDEGEMVIYNSKGSEPYSFKASITGTGWSVSPTSGSVAAGGEIGLVIIPPAQGNGTPNATNNGQLTITTNLPGDVAHPYTIDGTVTGGALSLPTAPVYISTYGGAATGASTLTNSGNINVPVTPVIVPSSSNPSDSNSLKMSFVSGSFADIGSTPITYTWTPGNEYDFAYTYTVYFPSTNGVSEICSAQTSQVVYGTLQNIP